ncbi:MAG: YjbH domain-containing protein [Bacteroidaceae bacterium]|nr:YjbH domain-containing protein [Bacteroidaceae bacterium]
MNGTRIIIVTLGFIFLPVHFLCGQEPATADVPQSLYDKGFEDIRTIVSSDTLYASIEDPTYRGTFRGAAEAIKSVAEKHPEIQHFEMILTDYKMPQLIVHASKREGIWDVRVDRHMRHALRKLQDIKPDAASTGKIDITFFPMFSFVNNKLDHLFDYSLRLAPAIATTLWRGSRLTLQPIFPILNNLDKDDTKRYIQIGNATLSQQIISTNFWQASASVGFFNPERFGAQAKVGFHASSALDFYLYGGYTLEANYTNQNGFGFVNNSAKANFMAKADFYERYSKLQIELQAGRFLFGDYGARFDLTRHFSEYAIGVYGILTEGEHNVGFHFAIPLGGKRQKRTAFIRPRLPEYYNFEYSMESDPQGNYWGKKMGRSYTTQPDENRSAHYWQPEYIKEYVARILNGTFQ